MIRRKDETRTIQHSALINQMKKANGQTDKKPKKKPPLNAGKQQVPKNNQKEQKGKVNPKPQTRPKRNLEGREVVITLRNISKTFKVREKNTDSIRAKVMNVFSSNALKEIKAVQNVNLEIRKGEFFGIIGRNGSGKSTLLKIIMGAIRADKGGELETKGRMMRLSLGMGFDPMLTARENVYINASILGLTFKEIGEKFDEIIAFAELKRFVDTPVKFYSRGMKSRLGFAVAVHADADIFLMDEFFGGVGDANFRKKSEKVFKQAFLKGRTIIHVSHQLETIKKHCDRAMVMHQGKVMGIGKPQEMIEVYQEVLKG